MRVGLALVLSILAESSALAADARFTVPGEEPGRPAGEMEVNLVPDLAITSSMFGVAFLLEQSKATWEGDVSCSDGPAGEDGACDPTAVNFFDRWVTGSTVDGASQVSDLLLSGLLLSPLVFAGIDAATSNPSGASAGGERFGQDSLVVMQTYAATYLATNLTKVIVKRLRPFNYDARFLENRPNGDARVSFPSGHSSMAFASAASLYVLLDQRHPDQGWASAVGVGGFVAATGVATLRVLASKHFPSDVLAGAVLGTTLGLLIPRFHRSDGVVAQRRASFISFGGSF